MSVMLPNFRKKAVLTIHGININQKNFIKYRKLFSLSNAVKKNILNRTFLNSVLIYNGVQISDIVPKQNYMVSDFFKILIISRLVTLKRGKIF
ncbi:MAG: hypothetical protein STSR0008_12110 [Ignavibacterium sp.]